MNKLSFLHKGFTFERITKKQAEKLYNEGLTIIFCPCKLHPFNSWALSMEINKININCDNKPFENIVNSYIYYNCNNEKGKYIAFYIPVDDNSNYDKRYMEV